MTDDMGDPKRFWILSADEVIFKRKPLQKSEEVDKEDDDEVDIEDEDA